MVAGAKIVGQADETVAVWAAGDALRPGKVLTADDLVATRVRFGEASAAAHYLAVEEQLPADLELLRPLEPGELVPAGALGAVTGEEMVRVPVALSDESVPAGLEAGTRVDVWVTDTDQRGRPEATLVLAEVAVAAAPRTANSFGASVTGRQVVLAIPLAEDDAVAQILAASSDDAVRIVERG